MDDSTNVSVRWATINPYEHEVILKQGTYEAHINGDHGAEDAAQRDAIEGQAKFVVEHPRYIIQDESNKSRYKYMDLVAIPNGENGIKFRPLTVIVETACVPHELVTWIPMSKIKESTNEEGLVYDACRGILR